MQVDYVLNVFNKSLYIRHVLDSIAAQKGDFTKNIIVVDDGSTDDSVAVIHDWAVKSYLPIKIITQENQGPSISLNRGLKELSGDYVKPLDADDVLHPEATQNLLNALENHPDAVIAFADPTHQDLYLPAEDGQSAQMPAIHGESFLQADTEIVSDPVKESLRNAKTTPSSWLGRRDVVEKSGGCNPKIFVQDYSFELALAALGPFVKTHAPIFYAPQELGERLSGNEAQTLHDINMAVADFVRDHPDLSYRHKRYALTRTTARASRWAKRYGLWGSYFKFSLLKTLGRLKLLKPSADIMRATCAVYEAKHLIRHP